MLQQLFRYSGRIGRRLVGVLVICLAGSLSLVDARDEPAPVIEAATQPGLSRAEGREMLERITRLERQLDSQALVDMLNNMDQLRQEIQRLLGQMEEQSHSLGELRKRQRDLYLDVDQRLRSVEETQAELAKAPLTPVPASAPVSAPVAAAASPATAASAAAAPAPPATVSAPATAPVTPGISAPVAAPAAAVTATPAATPPAQPDPQLERKHYEKAFTLLREGHYDQAVAALQAFLETFPNGRFADNAQYWLGEASYVQRRFADALVEFEKVVNNFPDSPKRADAMLKMGYTYQELGDVEKAMVTLSDVTRSFPDTTAAKLADRRLQAIKRQQ